MLIDINIDICLVVRKFSIIIKGFPLPITHVPHRSAASSVAAGDIRRERTEEHGTDKLRRP